MSEVFASPLTDHFNCAILNPSVSEKHFPNTNSAIIHDSSDDGSCWKAEKVVASVVREEGRFYQVKLARYMWLSAENLLHISGTQLIDEYWIACADNDTITCSTNNIADFVDLSNNMNCKVPATSFQSNANDDSQVDNDKEQSECDVNAALAMQHYPSSVDDFCPSAEGDNRESVNTCYIEVTHPNTEVTTASRSSTDFPLPVTSDITEVTNSSTGNIVNETEIQLNMPLNKNTGLQASRYVTTGIIKEEDKLVNMAHVLDLNRRQSKTADTINICKSDQTEVVMSPVINVVNSGDTADDEVMTNTEEKTFKCNLCNKSFNRKTSLQRHNLIHTGERPYSCKYCLKSFNQNAMLQRHVLIHENYRPFSCDLCGKTFVEKGALNRHVPTHDGSKTFKCPQCGKAFILKEYLTKHLFLHSGKKPYSCDKCEHTFADSSAFKRHQKVHARSSETTDYVCTICQKQHKKISALKKHEKYCNSASNSVSFPCIICKLKFHTKALLLMHRKTHSIELK